MSHEVESMMYVGETPWHGLGVSIPGGKELNVEEAILAAGLDWDVELRHIYTKDSKGSLHGILHHYVTCRTKDNTVLGLVGNDYQPLQNIEAFRWFQPFLDNGEAIIETGQPYERFEGMGPCKDQERPYACRKRRYHKTLRSPLKFP
jgi:hypothetical protein